MPQTSHRPLLGITIVALAGSTVAVAVAVRWPSAPQRKPALLPQPVSTVASNLRICLFTDGSAATQTAWAGMQDYARAGDVNIQRITVAPTAPDTDAYLTGLTQQGCKIIVAVGAGPVQAAEDAATRHPETRFVVIGSTEHRSDTVAVASGNLTGQTVTDAIRRADNSPQADASTNPG